MFRALCLFPLLAACAHRPAVVQHTSEGSSSPLLGTWHGALDASPVILRVFGSAGDGVHAELQLNHPDAQEHWVMMATPSNSAPLTFATADGMPNCSASLEHNRLVGSCEVEPGGRRRQWLVVRR